MRWDMGGRGGTVAGDLPGLTQPAAARLVLSSHGFKNLNHKCQALPRVVQSFPGRAPSNAARLEGLSCRS